MIPHYVWLNSKRKVVAITDAEAFTEANIDRYLSGQPLDLPLKEDILDYNPAQPLFNYNNGASSRAIIFRSSIAGYLKGLPKGMIRIVKDDGHSRLICINAPVIKIYYQLYGLRYRNRFVLETRRKSLFVSPKGLPDNYRITYELTYAQALTKRQVDNKALKDINNFLQVTTSVEKRLVDCWALVVRDKTKILVTNGAEAEVDTQDNYKGYKTFTNVSVAGFVATLNTQDFGASAIPIVLDETAFNQHVDFKLKVQGLHNIPDMRLQLQKYGFDLIPVQREMEMLVIKDI
ncbi:hypothetical protein GCM10027051_17370 [Niabella terrae]